MLTSPQREHALSVKRRRFLLAAGTALGAVLSRHGHAAYRRESLLNELAGRRWLQATDVPLPGVSAQSLIAAVVAGQTNRDSSAVAEELADEWWMRTLLALVQKYRLNPLRAARCLAYGAVALHDAGLEQRSVEPGDREFAREIAAGEVFAYMFPEEPKGRWPLDVVRRSRGLVPSRDRGVHAWRCGAATANAAIGRALRDGSDPGGAALQPPAGIVRSWKATAPLWASRPVEPRATSWMWWLVDPSIGDAVPPPLNAETDAYSADRDEVFKVQRDLTESQRRVAEQWDLDLGTITPAGVWVLKLFDVPAYRKSPFQLRTAALSLLTVTMLDAFIACWNVKYRWWTERPITAIQRDVDPSFMPHLITPAHPSYVSGHATVSGAAATILGELYPKLARDFHAMAEEAALSRLLAGIHFRSDNEQGLALGRRVGYAAANNAISHTF